MTDTNLCATRHSCFTGKERDAETGLDYFGARYYSGALGRWISADQPFADQHTQDPQSWNLFQYARNNPLRFVDFDDLRVREWLDPQISGRNRVPDAPHPDIPGGKKVIAELGFKHSTRGVFLVMNTVAVFEDSDNPEDYRAIREAYVGSPAPSERLAGDESPDTDMVYSVGNIQAQYDSPGFKLGESTGGHRGDLKAGITTVPLKTA